MTGPRRLFVIGVLVLFALRLAFPPWHAQVRELAIDHARFTSKTDTASQLFEWTVPAMWHFASPDLSPRRFRKSIDSVERHVVSSISAESSSIHNSVSRVLLDSVGESVARALISAKWPDDTIVARMKAAMWKHALVNAGKQEYYDSILRTQFEKLSQAVTAAAAAETAAYNSLRVPLYTLRPTYESTSWGWVSRDYAFSFSVDYRRLCVEGIIATLLIAAAALSRGFRDYFT